MKDRGLTGTFELTAAYLAFLMGASSNGRLGSSLSRPIKVMDVIRILNRGNACFEAPPCFAVGDVIATRRIEVMLGVETRRESKGDHFRH
jgi:hypothetical protein